MWLYHSRPLMPSMSTLRVSDVNKKRLLHHLSCLLSALFALMFRKGKEEEKLLIIEDDEKKENASKGEPDILFIDE